MRLPARPPATFRFRRTVPRPLRSNFYLGLVGLLFVLLMLGWASQEVTSGTTWGHLRGVGLFVLAAVVAVLDLRSILVYVVARVRAVSRLEVDPTRIVVRHRSRRSSDECTLAWADCAALVVSSKPLPGRKPVLYAQFVASRPDDVNGLEGADVVVSTGHLLDQPDYLAAMTAFLPHRHRRDLAELVRWVRHHQPQVRVVDSLGS